MAEKHPPVMPPVTIPQAVELALQHHEAGRLSEAEAIYRQILAVQPQHAEVHHLIGVIAHQRGQDEMAVEWIRRAIELGGGSAVAYSNLGEAYRALSRLDDALAAYGRALQLKPDLVAGHFNIGVTLCIIGRMEEAAESFQRVVELDPGYADAHRNLGFCLEKRGELAGAIESYRRSLRLQPDVAETYFNLGVAMTRQGQLEEALIAYRRAAELKPNYAEAHYNLGMALFGSGDLPRAKDSFLRALESNPSYVDAHYNLGNVLHEMGRLDEAENAYQLALSLDPNHSPALNNLGNLYKTEGRLEEAVVAYRRALKGDPSNAGLQSNVILVLHYMSGVAPEVMAEEQARWNRQFADLLKADITAHRNSRDPERRLRVGYVSADFRDHTLGRNLMPLFRNHDRRSFEVVCYSGVHRPDELTVSFRAQADIWRSTVNLSDEELAKRIREDEVDILVDLALHTSGSRLRVFAREPTPVQVSFAGYPGGTGVRGIGWRLSDRFLESGESSGRELVGLIDSFWCYDPCGMELPVNDLPRRAAGHVTFGSLNNFSKVNDGALALWARVMTAVDGSRLLLLSPQGCHRHHVLEILRKGGVTEDRVEFVEPRPRRKYLELYHRVDVMLDTFPYNGHTTSLDALWMGVPVVSLAGAQIVSRAGLSQLSNLDLPELVAFTENDYVKNAVELAHDLPRLERLRATLRSRTEGSDLMDGARFARGIESAYRMMWRRWCEGGDMPTEVRR